ncbi:MAG: M48 family metallopeptidase [Pseudomonadales bacterium]|nr:M48 family metalloprotease [Pseudomonadales bacterium]
MPDQFNAASIRCINDRKMAESLLTDPLIRRVNEQIARHEEDNPSGLRRRLLSTSVRLSARMAPDLHEMARECVERLEIDIEPELYVFASPQFNAMCFKPEEKHLYVMFSSSLIEGFDENELKFVVGHELGHHAYRHHDIPIGLVLQGNARPDPKLALSLFTWSRYAEISADRAGAHCARDIKAVSRALFKLASGLTGTTIDFHLDDFLAQVDEMQVIDQKPGEGAPKEDWFSTHPFSPLRVKALELFDQSEFARPGGVSAEDLEQAVQRVMGLMDPNYMQGRTKADEAMRRLLFAGAVLIGLADGQASEAEVEVFEKFFGRGSLKEGLDVATLEKSLPERMRQVRETASPSQAMQVLRDLCLLARAEGHTTSREREVLMRIADGLGLAEAIVDSTLCAEFEPD